LSFASIGNIEVRMLGNPEWRNFVLRRGVLGALAPAARVTEHLWQRGTVMVMHTDGLKSHWDLEMFPGIVRTSASAAAHELLRVLAKPDDDATVVVVKDRQHDTTRS
jgi:hypothetical protein